VVDDGEKRGGQLVKAPYRHLNRGEIERAGAPFGLSSFSVMTIAIAI
jgi:hypothetical protein